MAEQLIIAVSALSEDIVTGFVEGLRGGVIRPGDADYDSARAVWNGWVDKRPGLIVRCSGAADVISCVNFGRDRGLRVAVRGGSHGVHGPAVCDEGLVIDLSTMRGVQVDPERRIAHVQGGALRSGAMRALKFLVIAMAVLIVAGLALVAYGIVKRVGDSATGGGFVLRRYRPCPAAGRPGGRRGGGRRPPGAADRGR